SAAGAYFITICTQHRECLLGDIANGEMRLSPIGDCALSQWHDLPNRFPDIQLDAFVVMPNHIHGIFFINPVPAPMHPVGAPLAGAQMSQGAQISPNAPRTNPVPAPTNPVGAPLAGAQLLPGAQLPPGAQMLPDALNNGATLENRATARVAPTDVQISPNTPRTIPVGASLAGAQFPPGAQLPSGMLENEATLGKRAAVFDKRATLENRATARVAPTVGGVIGAYKSLVFNRCLL